LVLYGKETKENKVTFFLWKKKLKRAK